MSASRRPSAVGTRESETAFEIYRAAAMVVLMKDEPRQTRSHLMRLLESQGIHPRGDLGQNFLIDLNLLEFIVAQAELNVNDVVLEVGAGTGSMTTGLASQAGHVVSVEIDSTMYRLASEAVAATENVTLIHGDALHSKNRIADEVLAELDKQLSVSSHRQLKLVANLPYNIATPLVSNLVASELPWSRMIITIQYELALRMQARPASGHYGALSVWLQSQCRVKLLRKLLPTVFWPRPRVNSAVVRITPDEPRRSRIDDRGFFLEYVRGVFTHRRKLLRGVLAAMYHQHLDKSGVDGILQELQLPLQVRAEELTVAQHIELSNRLRKL